MRPSYEALLTAYHEAGHAAALLAHCVKFQHVAIFENGTGTVSVNRETLDRRRAATRCLCGPVAEARFARCTVDSVLSGPGMADLEAAREALGRRDVTDALTWAKRLLDRHWPAVRALAEALAMDGQLSYQRALSIWHATEVP